MDPTSHHAFSRQLACMAGHAYPHPAQQQGNDPLGMMDNKMGPMMRALTEDDMLMSQHQQQMAVAQGMYPQSYPAHQMHNPFSPGRNPQGVPFYPQTHGSDYAAAIQGGGYGISAAGYYQRQIPTPSPLMGSGLGSPNGQPPSSYPRSASAGPTIPSPIMMQGSSVYSNSSMYGVISTNSQPLSHSSPLPPRSMRSPAALQSPKSLPTSSPVPFTCSVPPGVNTMAFGGHNMPPSQSQSDISERQFPAVPKSPGQGRTFQYSPYNNQVMNPQGPVHPMSGTSRNRPTDQTDGVRSPPYVELVHSKSPSPLAKHQKVSHQSASQRRNENAQQGGTVKMDGKGSLPKLEEMVAFLGESAMNAGHDPSNPAIDHQGMDTVIKESNLPNISLQDQLDNGRIGQTDSSQQAVSELPPQMGRITSAETSFSQVNMDLVKPSPLMALPINSQMAVSRPEREVSMNHSRDRTIHEPTLRNMEDERGSDRFGQCNLVVNGSDEQDSPLSSQDEQGVSSQEEQEFGLHDMNAERGNLERNSQQGLTSPKRVIPNIRPLHTVTRSQRSTARIDGHSWENRTVDQNSSGICGMNESKQLEDGEEKGDKQMIDDHQALMDVCSVPVSTNRDETREWQDTKETEVVAAQNCERVRNQSVTEDHPHRTSNENTPKELHASCSVKSGDDMGEHERDSRTPMEENVAKKDVKGVVTLVPNSPEKCHVPDVESQSDVDKEQNRQPQTKDNETVSENVEHRLSTEEAVCIESHNDIDGQDSAKKMQIKGCSDSFKENISASENVNSEETLIEKEQGKECKVRLDRSMPCVESGTDASKEALCHSPTIQKAPIIENSEPPNSKKISCESSADKGLANTVTEASSGTDKRTIGQNSSEKDQADNKTVDTTEANVLKIPGVSKGQLIVTTPKGTNSVPVLIANGSTLGKKAGEEKVDGKSFAKGQPIVVKVQPAGQKVVSPKSDQSKKPMFLVASGQSPLKMNAASVVITPLRIAGAKNTFTSPRKIAPARTDKPATEEKPSGSEATLRKKRPMEETPLKDHSNPSKKRPVENIPLKESSAGASTTPAADPSQNTSGDQSALPLKKRKGRPPGAKTKIRRGENPSKGSGRKSRNKLDSEEEQELSKFKHVQSVKKGLKTKRVDSPNRGPILSITGSIDDVLSSRVINSSDSGPTKTKRVSRVLSIPSSVTTKGPTSDASTVTVHPRGKWHCSFCGKRSFFGTLGDLYGPYYPTGFHSEHIKEMEKNAPKCPSSQNWAPIPKKMPLKSPPAPKGGKRTLRTYPGKTKNGPTFLSASPPPRNLKVLTVYPSKGRGQTSPSTSSQGGMTSPRSRAMELEREEVWVHEDCLVWSQGVFAVGGTLHGLHAAVKEAVTVVCTRCQDTGATLGCRAKGCSKAFHYLCAIEVGCLLHEENFSMTCPQHKNKKLKMREDPT